MVEILITAVVTAAVSVIGTHVVDGIRYRRNSKLQIASQDATKELLESANWRKRSFKSIKARLGGFEDDELRKMLVSVGAVRFTDDDDRELWGLRSRNDI